LICYYSACSALVFTNMHASLLPALNQYMPATKSAAPLMWLASVEGVAGIDGVKQHDPVYSNMQICQRANMHPT